MSEVYNQYTDTAGNYHFTDVETGNHTLSSIDYRYYQEITDANNALIYGAPKSQCEPVELIIGDEVYSTVDKPPYGMVINDDSHDGYVRVLWWDGLIGGLRSSWLHKTGKHYPIEKWMEEMERGT